MELCISLPPLGGNSLENLRSELLIKKTIDDKNSEDAHFMFSAFRQIEKKKRKKNFFFNFFFKGVEKYDHNDYDDHDNEGQAK